MQRQISGGGRKSCESRHIDDGILSEAFINILNTMNGNREYFNGKRKKRLESNNALVQYKMRQCIAILTDASTMKEFDLDLYFALVEKMTVYDGSRIVVTLWMERRLSAKLNRDRQ